MGAGEIIAGIAQGVLGPVASVVGSIINYHAQEETNQANKDINQSNIDYNTAMTQQQWERDDTAHQREVADLEAAGLSPLANMSGTTTSAALGAPSPIAMQAPKVDTNALINSVLGAQQLEETIRHNKAQEGLQDTGLQLQAKELKLKADSLELEDKKLQEQIRYNSGLLENEAKRIAEVQRSNKANEEIKLKDYQIRQFSEESQHYFKTISQQVGGRDIPTKDIYDYNEYIIAKQKYDEEFSSFLDTLKADSTAKGKSKNWNGAVGAGASIAGTGGNGNIAGGSGSSEYDSESISGNNDKRYESWLLRHPCPVFIDKSQYKELFK